MKFIKCIATRSPLARECHTSPFRRATNISRPTITHNYTQLQTYKYLTLQHAAETVTLTNISVSETVQIKGGVPLKKYRSMYKLNFSSKSQHENQFPIRVNIY